MFRLSLAAVAALACCACSSLPLDVPRETSHAFARPQDTRLGQAFLALAARHPGKSGFVPVAAGANAFLLRAAMVSLAERAIDLQYYIWEDDLTGRMMLHEVARAADRGVRVRLLLDDIHTEGDTGVFRCANAHPMIEVRLFNPFVRRELRLADWLLEGARLNHRMHNKVMISDGAIAITGGRNIGDHYFAVDEESNFRDLDLLALGPVVGDLAAMFDDYWNSEWAYPIEAIDDRGCGKDDARIAQPSGTLPFPADATAEAMRARLSSWGADAVWGRARVIHDSPSAPDGEADGGRNVAAFLFDSVNGVRKELLIETAYFVPGDSGVELLEALVDQGVKVVVLTNSLATNDVIAAHAGYMDYREALLRAGVVLHELRPDAAAQKRHLTLLASGSQAALHTKALVYDRRAVLIGSFNLDPRSLRINTEMGLLIESPRLAADIADRIALGLQPTNSYRLVLRDGDLHWQVGADDGMRLVDTEPETNWWDRFVARLISLLPINGQL